MKKTKEVVCQMLISEGVRPIEAVMITDNIFFMVYCGMSEFIDDRDGIQEWANAHNIETTECLEK